MESGGVRIKIVLPPRVAASAAASNDTTLIDADAPELDEAPLPNDDGGGSSVGAAGSAKKKYKSGRHKTIGERAADAKVLCDRLEKTVILQFGSRNMRVGLGVELSPRTVPAVVAYRTSGHVAADAVCFPSSVAVAPDVARASIAEAAPHVRARESEVAHLAALQRRANSSGTALLPVADPSLSSSSSDATPWHWTDVSQRPRVLCGHDALRVPVAAPYRLVAPLRRGNLNTGEHASLQHVIDALVHLVRHAMNSVLGIAGHRFPQYSVALVVGDSWTQVETCAVYGALFNELEFASVFAHQESVLACFGCGVSSALVIDLGAEKTSVCCGAMLVAVSVCIMSVRVCLYFYLTQTPSCVFLVFFLSFIVPSR